MSSQENSIKLDIGGTIFKTTKSTLIKFDGLFKALVETDAQVPQNQEKIIFIDRDPTHFRIILNFMRDGDVRLPNDKDLVEDILREANYYSLEGLVEMCEKKFPSKKSKNSSWIPNYMKVLDTNEEVLQVIENLEKPVFIIYYPAEDGHPVFLPPNFDPEKFVEQYCSTFEIYFKKCELKDNNSTLWKYVIHGKKSVISYNKKSDVEQNGFAKSIEENVLDFFIKNKML